MAADQFEINRQQKDRENREKPHVERVEPTERAVAHLGAANDQRLRDGTHNRSTAGDASLDVPGPVAVLVPDQGVAGQGKTNHQAEQAEAHPPVEFARGGIAL